MCSTLLNDDTSSEGVDRIRHYYRKYGRKGNDTDKLINELVEAL